MKLLLATLMYTKVMKYNELKCNKNIFYKNSVYETVAIFKIFGL